MGLRIQLLAAVSLAHLLLFPAQARGADTFTLSVAPTGPPFYMGKAGDAVVFSCDAYVQHAGTGDGAEAWSFGIAVDGASVTSATTVGTQVESFRDPAGSVEKIHIIDPAENGGMSGVVSSVVLSTQGLGTAVLPAGFKSSVLGLVLEAKVPEGGGKATFELRGDLRAGGETFPLSVTQDGVEIAPDVRPPLEIRIFDSNDCCVHPLNLGFSEAIIKNGHAFDGIAGEEEKCLAAGGEIIAEAPLGAVNSTTVHVNIISNLPGNNVQGWNLGVAVDGSATIRSITTAGTSADTIPKGYRDPENSLARIQIIDPATNGGQMGILASAALTTMGLPGAVLPAVATQTVLRIELAAAEPQGNADQTATLRFQNGLVGSGGPVDLVITVGGQSAPVCNADRAGVTVVFRKRADAPFRRGDSNDDARIDISDAVATLNALFSGGPQPACRDAADGNDDGVTDISDPVFVLNFLFAGESPPPPPGSEACGSDPTTDNLDCLESICP